MSAIALVCSTLVGCGSVPNSGISGPSLASIRSTNDPGVHNGFDRQVVTDEAGGIRQAIFRSSHPGASEDGVGRTDWFYARSIDLDYAKLISGKYNLTPEVVRFFRECAPTVDPDSRKDAFLSGRVKGTSKARLVLTQLAWHTEVGPGPGDFSTARVSEATVEVFGSTAGVPGPLSLEVRLSYAPSTGAHAPVYARNLSNINVGETRANCSARRLEASPKSLGGSNWFPRGDVNNLRVEIVER